MYSAESRQDVSLSRCLIENHIARVEVHPERLIVQVRQGEARRRDSAGLENTLGIPWQKTAVTRRRQILVPEGTAAQQARRIRSENRATLVASIARGRLWLEELVLDSTATAETIAKRETCTSRKINMTISLAFLAPNLVKAAIDGTLPHGMGVVRLADLPAEWSQQQDAWPSMAQRGRSNRVSANRVFGFRETRILGPETKPPNHPETLPAAHRDLRRLKKARQLRTFLICSGNLRSPASAWWAREDSNLQPSGYERPTLLGKINDNRHF
jgi:hypothetical protein